MALLVSIILILIVGLVITKGEKRTSPIININMTRIINVNIFRSVLTLVKISNVNVFISVFILLFFIIFKHYQIIIIVSTYIYYNDILYLYINPVIISFNF